MAKELPYFKFEPNQWENGNIQICSREDKGLFLDLCSMYWARLGDLPFKLAVQKLCGGNATAFDSLMQENIFSVIDGFVCIGFLNEQLEEFDNTSKQNSQNAMQGWEKRRKNKASSDRNATASNPQSESDAIREEKSKGKKIKEEFLLEKETKVNISERKQIFYNSLIPFTETYGKVMLREFYEYWTEHGEKDLKFRKEKEKTFGIERRLKTWSTNNFNKNTGNGKQFTSASKKPARFSIARAEQTLRADAERKQREMEDRNSRG